MSSAKSLDLTTELEVSPYPVVSQDAEAVYNGSRLPYGLHHGVGIKIEVS